MHEALRAAFEKEMRHASERLEANDERAAFRHYERAHVLGRCSSALTCGRTSGCSAWGGACGTLARSSVNSFDSRVPSWAPLSERCPWATRVAPT